MMWMLVESIGRHLSTGKCSEQLRIDNNGVTMGKLTYITDKEKNQN